MKTLGKTLEMNPDDAQSYLFNGVNSAQSSTVGPVYGNDLTNNAIFPIVQTATAAVNTGVAGIPNGEEQSFCGNYFTPGSVQYCSSTEKFENGQ